MCVPDSSSSHATQNHGHKSSSKISSSAKSVSSSQNAPPSSKLKNSSSAKDAVDSDTDPSRIKTLCDSPDHISAKLNQRILSADYAPVVPPPSSITSSVASDDSNSSSNTTETPAPLQTASHRPKTVKTLGSKMRSTGKQNRASCLLAFMLTITFYCDSLPTFSLVLRTLCFTD